MHGQGKNLASGGQRNETMAVTPRIPKPQLGVREAVTRDRPTMSRANQRKGDPTPHRDLVEAGEARGVLLEAATGAQLGVAAAVEEVHPVVVAEAPAVGRPETETTGTTVDSPPSHLPQW